MTEFSKELWDAIKRDDVKKYLTFSEEIGIGDLRLGRFPLLSIFYIYRSKKLIARYEKQYLKINAYRTATEPFELYLDFTKVAGKCLRLYAGNENVIVSPLEALLITGKTHKLRKVYPSCVCSPTVRKNLSSAYAIKYGLGLSFNGNDVVMDRRPLSRYEKKRILLSSISALLCIAIIISTPFVVNVYLPFIGKPDDQNENNNVPEEQEKHPPVSTEIDVTDPSQINSSSSTTYNLMNDISLSSFTSSIGFSIKGNGHTVTLTDANPLFKEFKGKLENINFVVSNDNITLEQSSAFITVTNLGTISNCSLSVNGKVTIISDKETPQNETYLAGFALENYGTIEKCNFSGNLSIKSNINANASFSGFCSINNYLISDCSTAGSIEAETTDLSGFCNTNNRTIKNCVNGLTMTHNTSEYKWSPLVAGITLNNKSGTISECKNISDLKAVSSYSSTEEIKSYYSVTVAGITATDNGGNTFKCTNSGNITADSIQNISYASGIVAETSSIVFYGSVIEGCQNNGSVYASSDIVSAYASGIVSVYDGNTLYGGISSCTNNSVIEAKIEKKENIEKENDYSNHAISSGICSYLIAGIVNDCSNSGEVKAYSNSKTDISLSGGICGLSSYNSNIERAKNNGTIKSQSGENYAYAGGICGINQYSLRYCQNSGNINAISEKDCYVGGISGTSYRLIEYSENSGNSVGSSKEKCYVGGITGYNGIGVYNNYIYTSVINRCISSGSISIATDSKHGEAFIGGITGFSDKKLYNANTQNEINACAQITNSFFKGSIVSNEKTYVGQIVGGTDKYLADNNDSAGDSNGTSSPNNFFTNNLYLTQEVPVTAVGVFISAKSVDDTSSEITYEYSDGSDLGSASATNEEIESNEIYKSIKSNLNK